MCLALGRRRRLDDIRVNRALRQPAHIVQARRGTLKGIHEGRADGLALGFRIGEAGQRGEKGVTGIHRDQIEVQGVGGAAGEGRLHLLALAEAQQAVIDENAGEAITDGPFDERRRDAGIDSAGEPEHHPIHTHLAADQRHALIDDAGRCPSAVAAADVAGKAAHQLGAATGLGDFGVELHTIEAPVGVRHRRDGRARRAGGDAEARRQGGHAVAVAHPHRQIATGPQAIEQPMRIVDGHFRRAELLPRRTFHRATELAGHGLHPIADAEHRHPRLEHTLRNPRRLGRGGGLRPAGQHDATRPSLGQVRCRGIPRHDLAIDAGFTHPPGDELGGLRAEIQYQQALFAGVQQAA